MREQRHIYKTTNTFICINTTHNHSCMNTVTNNTKCESSSLPMLVSKKKDENRKPTSRSYIITHCLCCPVYYSVNSICIPKLFINSTEQEKLTTKSQTKCIEIYRQNLQVTAVTRFVRSIYVAVCSV